MALTFVPFTPQAQHKAVSETSSASSTEAVPFSAFTSSQPPSVAAPRAEAPASAPVATPCHAEPQITLERDQDRITQIRINCPCGQVIQIACGY